jgi:quercetin dioxygenase-like cupin family protein
LLNPPQVTSPIYFVGPPKFKANNFMQPALRASSLPSFPYLEGHFSRLPLHRMHSPHRPHAHYDEELVIVLNGSLRIAYSSRHTTQIAFVDSRTRSEVPMVANSTSIVYDAPRGTIAVHSSQNNHTLAAIDGVPVFYFCLRLVGTRVVEQMVSKHASMEVQRGSLARTRILTPSSRVLATWDGAEGGAGHMPLRTRVVQTLVDSLSLAGGETLHIHATLTPPGGGYDTHADAYDVLLLTLAGSVEITGPSAQRLGPYSLALLPAGSMHGHRNVGSTPSVHYVIEMRGAEHLAL